VPNAEPDVEAPELPPARRGLADPGHQLPGGGSHHLLRRLGRLPAGRLPRRHIGNDLIGRRLRPLLAATDGVVTHLVLDHPTAGWGLVITDVQGWNYRYYHVNNDTPSTDDGAAPPQWRLAPGITEGSTVTAGQVVAYLGDSGNSELSVPHLHFEIHQPDGSPIDPYRSLRAAEWLARCSVAAPGVQKESALCRPSTRPRPTWSSPPPPVGASSCSAWTGPSSPRATPPPWGGAATSPTTRPARRPARHPATWPS
jgi:hypothetical protein